MFGGSFEKYSVFWLVVGQLSALLLSTAAFAILARLLGPEPFAAFALTVFVFTAASLALDLSPAGFLLTRSANSDPLAVAWKLTGVSAATTAIVVFTASILVLEFAPIADDIQPQLIGGMLAAAAVAQLANQIPRATLVMARAYRRAAAGDVGAALISGVTAIFFTAIVTDMSVLVVQLLIAALARLTLNSIFCFSLSRDETLSRSDTKHSLADAIKYGLSVIPLNIASYLSRSLDSGLFPLLAPAAAAAGYARSYQLVVTPLTQAQASLGAPVIAGLARSEFDKDKRQAFVIKLWIVVLIASTGAAILLSLLAPVIEAVLFGPGWPMASVFIAAMAAVLPTAAISTYFSWSLQVSPKVANSLAHLGLILVSPLLVITTLAVTSSVQAATAILPLGSLLSAVAMILKWRQYLPSEVNVLKAIAAVAIAWAVVCSIFIWTASSRGFWGFSAW